MLWVAIGAFFALNGSSDGGTTVTWGVSQGGAYSFRENRQASALSMNGRRNVHPRSV